MVQIIMTVRGDKKIDEQMYTPVDVEKTQS
jgi:hypothetical protein